MNTKRKPGYRKARADQRREERAEHGRAMYREYKKHHGPNTDNPRRTKSQRRKAPALSQLERLGRGFMGG